MATDCRDCKHYLHCFANVNSISCDFFDSLKTIKKYVLIHNYIDTGFSSIVAFSDDIDELYDIRNNHSLFGSSRHDFIVSPNSLTDNSLFLIKDNSLINICKNVAQYLSIGEYAMLKKSYFKASAWFEKAKNSASLGADILENY